MGGTGTIAAGVTQRPRPPGPRGLMVCPFDVLILMTSVRAKIGLDIPRKRHSPVKDRYRLTLILSGNKRRCRSMMILVVKAKGALWSANGSLFISLAAGVINRGPCTVERHSWVEDFRGKTIPLFCNQYCDLYNTPLAL